MKSLFLSLVGCVLALGGSDVLAQQTSAAPATLKVSIVIPEIVHPYVQHPVQRILINQQPDSHFHVVLENVSDHPITLNGGAGGGDPLSFEVTEADGSVLKIEQAADKGGKSFGFRLAPGELHVREVYYTTQEQYFAVTRHAPFARWWPEFPFSRDKEKTVTLRAVYEEGPSIRSREEKFWTGRVVSVPCKVVLIYP
jgi:hypothetical protein